MAFSPANPPFLAARPVSGPAVAVVGVPLDLTQTFRAGTALGPHTIRVVSDCLETYSPDLDRDLEDVPFADLGDLSLSGLSVDESLSVIHDAIAGLPEGILPIILGGEHTLTLATAGALLERHADLAVLQVDAHLDLIDEYAGLRISHATVMRRLREIIGADSLFQVGVRSGTRAEWELAEEGNYARTLQGSTWMIESLGRRPVYLSIDIDVLDSSCAPGTGCPEPGGASSTDLLNFVRSLNGLNVVAVDIVETSPPHDSADRTSIVAAKVVREMALLYAPSLSN